MQTTSTLSRVIQLLKTDEESLFNCRKKYIFDENGEMKLLQTMVCEKAIFNPYGLERERKKKTEAELEKLQREREALLEAQTENMSAALDDRLSEIENQNRLSASRRAKRKVFDYVLANPDLCYFVTLTLNGEKFSRYNIPEACKKLNKYLANRVQRQGLKYVFVPELHKDGAIHFHGLINEAVKMMPSGTFIPPEGGKPLKAVTLKRKGIPLADCQEVFNVADWEYGYTTAMHIYGERGKTGSYVAKYITKQESADFRKICGRYYYSSNNLSEPYFEYSNEDFEAFEGFEIDGEFLHAKISNGEI